VSFEYCPFHTDEPLPGKPLNDGFGTESFECDRIREHPSGASFVWARTPAPPDAESVSGIAADLGLDLALPQAIASFQGRWVEYGLVEREYARGHPGDFEWLYKRYGHSHDQDSKQYTVSAFLASTLGTLSRHGSVRFHSGAATGRWSYNGNISYWAVDPEPQWEDRLSWESAGADVDYLAT
jgi:hypothetical protein